MARCSTGVSGLHVDRGLVESCRDLAATACAPILEQARSHTTVSVERACLRLVGVVDSDSLGTFDLPLVNRVVDAIRRDCGLEDGVMIPFFHVVAARGEGDVNHGAHLMAAGEVTAVAPRGDDLARAEAAALEAARAAHERLLATHEDRQARLDEFGDTPYPWFYVIVATGDIREDIRQARAVAKAGVHVVAVIRSTAQSLLDFVPNGATTTGYGGTYATQENFRLMREALDSVSREVGHYVRQTNFASGLCMPEMAVLAAFERLDIMLNDSMYGVLFRDINPQRTFIDQHFSRQVHAAASIMVNTGEDAYLKIDDPVAAAHTVLASNFLNEHLALAAGLPPDLIGLGRAAEIDPAMDGQISAELAHAQLARECFPESPMKWMPPTRHLDGDLFMSFLYHGIYNLVGHLTGQDILLLGMLSEGVHNPLVADRDLAAENALYVRRAAAGLSEQLTIKPSAAISERADRVLRDCHDFLEGFADAGLFDALERGLFVGVERSRTGGRGLEGVIRRGAGYRNPVIDELSRERAAIG